jgi:hypothetical protein
VGKTLAGRDGISVSALGDSNLHCAISNEISGNPEQGGHRHNRKLEMSQPRQRACQKQRKQSIQKIFNSGRTPRSLLNDRIAE